MPPDWPDGLIAAVEALNGGALTDDVAVLALSYRAEVEP
jgi:hypothetical protein